MRHTYTGSSYANGGHKTDTCHKCGYAFIEGDTVYSNGDGSFNCHHCEQSFECNGVTYYYTPTDDGSCMLCRGCSYYTHHTNFVSVNGRMVCSSCVNKTPEVVYV